MAPTPLSDVMGGGAGGTHGAGGGRSLHTGRTGDLEGNLNRVTRELRRIRFPVDFDSGGAREGSPMALLPALHYAMLGFSRHVTGSLSEAGHDLQAKSDGRFVENAWKAVRMTTRRDRRCGKYTRRTTLYARSHFVYFFLVVWCFPPSGTPPHPR